MQLLHQEMYLQRHNSLPWEILLALHACSRSVRISGFNQSHLTHMPTTSHIFILLASDCVGMQQQTVQGQSALSTKGS